MATHFLSGVAARFDELLGFPLSGAPRHQLAPDLRAIFKGNYAIYYSPRAGEILIVRVLHGSRDVATIAAEGGFAF